MLYIDSLHMVIVVPGIVSDICKVQSATDQVAVSTKQNIITTICK